MEAVKKEKNDYRCFGFREYLVIIIALTISIVPFITIGILQSSGDYNVINWSDYYGNGSNYSYQIHGNFINDTINNTVNYQHFFHQNKLLTIPLTLNGKTQEMKFGSRQYRFIMNGSSDLVFNSQYTFPSKAISIYYPFLYGLPISIMTNTYDGSVYNPSLGTFQDMFNFTSSTLPIPSNWSDVWNNMEIYFYYVDHTNTGFGFEWGKNQTITPTTMDLITPDYGTLHLNMFNLNISGEMGYYQGIGQYHNFPQFYYHDKSISNGSISSQYFQLFFGNSDPFGTTNGNSFLSSIFQYLNIQYDIRAQSYPSITYDNSLLEAEQIYGYPVLNEFPIQNAEKCGYYIKINSGFNITKYYDGFPSYFMNNVIADSNSGQFYSNGINIYDGGLYLGKLSSVIDNITTSFYYDLLVIIGLVGSIIVLMILLKYSTKAKEFKEKQTMVCRNA